MREKKVPGKCRLLHNLSFPYNEDSVNYNIPSIDSRVQYENISDAIKLVQRYPNAYIAKTDIADAFRLIPLHPSQYTLTGFHFEGYYFDRCLPMGCSSSCKIFERFSSALKWILLEHYGIANVVKVLDDFLFVASSESECNHYLSKFKKLCNQIGVPIAHHKTEGPSNCLTFLGIELDSKNMVARLPIEKLSEYSSNIRSMLNSSKCTLRELKSIIGKLQFSTSVVTPGRPFLRRLYDATMGVKQPHFHLRITEELRADLLTWQQFLDHYNGVTIITPSIVDNSSELSLLSDSSKIGYGGVFGTHFIYGSFPLAWQKFDIQFLEIFPIFVLVNVFKFSLANKNILFFCDNSAVVSPINKQTSKNKLVMVILRKLVLTFLKHNIKFRATHIPGKNNILCDKLSRLQVSRELLEAFGMDTFQTPVPNYLRPQNFNLKS